jgi:ABC-type transport system involved in multi-copper enzyme maturation permease subunit
MISHVIKKEILENLLSYRFFILTGLLLLLMSVALIVGYGDLKQRQDNYEILRPTSGNPNVIIAPTPLSVLAKGLEENLTRLHEISVLGIQIRQNQQSVNRIFSLFAAPDLLFTIKVVLALLALLFSFDAITHEKEQGTLRLLLSHSLRRPSLIIGKLLGRFVLIAVPFTILFLVFLLSVSLLPAGEATGDFWIRSFVILLVALCYTLLFTAIGLCVSSYVHRSSTSLVLGLALWLLFVFIMPNFGTTIARSVTKTPPADRIEMEGRLNTIRAIYERLEKEKKDPGHSEGRWMMLQIKESTLRLIEAHRPPMNAHVRTSQTILRFSPSGALHLALTDIATTGLYEEGRLKDAVVEYAGRNFDKINQLEPGPPEPFIYQRSPLSEVLVRSGLIDLVIIVIYTAVFVIAAYVRFLRYDPR